MPPRSRQVMSPANRIFNEVREVVVPDREKVAAQAGRVIQSIFVPGPVCVQLPESDTHGNDTRFGGSREATPAHKKLAAPLLGRPG